MSSTYLSQSKDRMLIHNVTSHFHRDIYYTDSQLFGNQASVDNIIDDISCMLKVPRRSLHVVSHSKYKILSQNKGELPLLPEQRQRQAGSQGHTARTCLGEKCALPSS